MIHVIDRSNKITPGKFVGECEMGEKCKSKRWICVIEARKSQQVVGAEINVKIVKVVEICTGIVTGSNEETDGAQPQSATAAHMTNCGKKTMLISKIAPLRSRGFWKCCRVIG